MVVLLAHLFPELIPNICANSLCYKLVVHRFMVRKLMKLLPQSKEYKCKENGCLGLSYIKPGGPCSTAACPGAQAWALHKAGQCVRPTGRLQDDHTRARTSGQAFSWCFSLIIPDVNQFLISISQNPNIEYGLASYDIQPGILYSQARTYVGPCHYQSTFSCITRQNIDSLRQPLMMNHMSRHASITQPFPGSLSKIQSSQLCLLHKTHQIRSFTFAETLKPQIHLIALLYQTHS